MQYDDGTTLEVVLEGGFSALPAEEVLMRCCPRDKYPNLYDRREDLRDLFGKAAPSFLSYRSRIRHNTMLSERGVEIRVTLVLYSIWMVPGILEPYLIDELRFWGAQLWIKERLSILRLVEYILNIDNDKLETISALLEDINNIVMDGPFSPAQRRRYAISHEAGYSTFAMSPIDELRSTRENMRKIYTAHLRKRPENIKRQKFEDFHKENGALISELESLRKSFRYQDIIHACQLYIDRALTLSEEIGHDHDFQIVAFFDDMSLALIKVGKLKEARDCLRQLFVLDTACWSSTKLGDRKRLVDRLKKLSEHVEWADGWKLPQ
jgi:hypothetical protein